MNKEQFNYDIHVQIINRSNEIKRLQKIVNQLYEYKNYLIAQTEYVDNNEKIIRINEDIIYILDRITELKRRNGIKPEIPLLLDNDILYDPRKDPRKELRDDNLLHDKKHQNKIIEIYNRLKAFFKFNNGDNELETHDNAADRHTRRCCGKG